MAEIKHVNEKDFHSVVEESDVPVLVDFYAQWCGPCKMVAPELEKLADDCSDIKIVKIDVDENNNLAEKFNIHNIPCMVLFEHGEPKKAILGYRTCQQLKAAITEE